MATRRSPLAPASVNSARHVLGGESAKAAPAEPAAGALRCDLAQNLDHLDVLVGEVLKHRALDARRLVGAEELDDPAPDGTGDQR